MISTIDNIIPQLTGVGLLGVLSVFSVRLILKKLKFSYLMSFVWIMVISLAGYFIINLLHLWGFWRDPYLFKLDGGLILCFQFAYLSIISYIYMDNPTKKKGRTLLRLPIIGFLLGYYMSEVENMVIFALVELLITFLLFKKSKSHNYAFRAQTKALIPVPLIAMYSFPMSSWFAIYLGWSLHFKFALANAAIVKNLMVDYDSSLHEE
tara:strand:- start:1147 stop:1770 length:624 start_codon:yes stop_codon:yes gene_type:complete